MSGCTPSRFDRFERHIMRQRGAGARDIAADFGFSFGNIDALSASREEPRLVKKLKVQNSGHAVSEQTTSTSSKKHEVVSNRHHRVERTATLDKPCESSMTVLAQQPQQQSTASDEGDSAPQAHSDHDVASSSHSQRQPRQKKQIAKAKPARSLKATQNAKAQPKPRDPANALATVEPVGYSTSHDAACRAKPRAAREKPPADDGIKNNQKLRAVARSSGSDEMDGASGDELLLESAEARKTQTASARSTPASKRVPLKSMNVNVAINSVSPKKQHTDSVMELDVAKLAKPTRRSRHRKPVVPSRSAHAEFSQSIERNKLAQQQSDQASVVEVAETEHASNVIPAQRSAREPPKKSSRINPEVALNKDASTSAVSAPRQVEPHAKPPEPAQRVSKPRIVQSNDLDWLSGPQKSLAASKPLRTAKQSRLWTKSNGEVEDVDLEDLVTNICSIAAPGEGGARVK